MNLYYANGGGLGHLTRANAFLHQFGIENETAILTASKFAADKRVLGNTEIIKIDENFSQNKVEYRSFLQKTIIDRSAEKIYLDSFPAGIIGEFADFNFGKTEVFYIARLLKWKNYSQLLNGTSFHFKKTYILENLKNEHIEFIKKNSEEIVNLDLLYPNKNKECEKNIKEIVGKFSPFWLIVHAGDFEEITELLEYAEEMKKIESSNGKLILISPDTHPNITNFNIYPASALFPFAERIITACGFNVIKQTANFRNKHFFLPFERRYDDQFARAENLKYVQTKEFSKSL